MLLWRPAAGRPYGPMVTGRFGAPRQASALGESRSWAQERCDPLLPACGCSRISKLVLRVAGRTDVPQMFLAHLSRETEASDDGMADQTSWLQGLTRP